jgi:hypothetical protein
MVEKPIDRVDNPMAASLICSAVESLNLALPVNLLVYYGPGGSYFFCLSLPIGVGSITGYEDFPRLKGAKGVDYVVEGIGTSPDDQ